MRVRLAANHDKDDWIRMRSALWPHSSVAEHNEEIDFYLTGRSRGSPPLAAVFIAEGHDGTAAGFIELAVRDYAEGCTGPTPYIEAWYVDVPHRGRGVGRALIQAAADWSRDHGFDRLASDAEIANTASHEAHEALGFREVERIVVFLKSLGDST